MNLIRCKNVLNLRFLLELKTVKRTLMKYVNMDITSTSKIALFVVKWTSGYAFMKEKGKDNFCRFEDHYSAFF